MGFKRRHRLVAVCWRDSSNYNGWQPDGNERPLADCETVGFVVGDSDKQLEVAQSVGGDQVCDVMVIPRECVLSVRKIK